ncbi:uncharacterized protein LOC118437231 [Folsomia candida]|nr:uncharacterized protein LOC118437231 [Folsomia candida]
MTASFFVYALLLTKGSWNEFTNALAFLAMCIFELSVPRSYYSKFSSNRCSRLILTFWFGAIFVISSDLKTAFISNLTKPELSHPPADFEQLYEAKEYKIGFASMNSTAEGSAFISLAGEGNQIISHLNTRVFKDFPNFDEECLRITQKARHVCMGSLHGLIPEAIEELVTNRGRKLFRLAKSPFISFHTVGFVSMKMPHILPTYNRILLKYMESGVMDYLWEGYNEQKKSLGIKVANEREVKRQRFPSEVESVPERGQEIYVTTIGVGVCGLLAVVTLAGERSSVVGSFRKVWLKWKQ